MYERRWSALLLPLLITLTNACSDDDPAVPGANVSTGLPTDSKLSSFDDAAAKTACQALNDGASELISDRELVRAQCASRAIGALAKPNQDKTAITLDLALCAMLSTSCESDPVSYGVMAESGSDQADCSDATANDQVMHCDATVAEYEACISKLLDKAKSTLAKISCDNAKELLEGDGAATKLDPKSVPECKTFLDQCPDVQIAISIGG